MAEASVNYVSLSKALSKALRHRPERLGLTLAPDGSVALSVLVDALNRRGGWPREITQADIMQVVEHGSKQRFSVEDGRIRARYGHSLAVDVTYSPARPPQILYHGTSRTAAEVILVEGLLPMGRQKVHLSTDEETAIQVGRRHGKDVVVLHVDAVRAANAGISFYQGNHDTLLADSVPAAFISCPAMHR